MLIGFASPTFAINPDREYIRTPDSVAWNYEQLSITTKDHFQLNTWIYEANKENNKDTVIVLAYPDAGNMSYFVYQAAILANAGYTVVTFDYRGFGKSDDFEIEREYLYYTEFAWDLEAVVDTIAEKFNDSKIGVLGMSMGTTIASRAFPSIKDKVDFIIGEGYVTDTSAIIERYKALEKNLILPEKPKKYKKAIKAIDIPLLIFTASNDTITTHQDAESLYQLLGQNCEVVKYSGEHLTGFQVDYEYKGFGGWYVEQINFFLDNAAS
ncbi:alpha/beta fold hydrolase [Cyclobacterium sp. 1_MG-2023]|uniref:alpha/beta hydrolase n=1 Tax=Cyclobacterium sp. 1_MG-2023 TaxID=3062681 RepID=UPI0026E1A780|nr:alpha/beta fold hydrolase [Cyclobacterium sp. 1_MG-2023]MDO6436089.1 alpha/beta fold hydrolase [Cyclobacterium sp. 1_MG-2023]